MADFEPKIIAFCCQYCDYAAADLAGSMRLQYAPQVRIVRVLCTGRVDELWLLRAFENGADGVFVAGCLEGTCHFQQGNLRARKRVQYVKKLLDEVGVGGERLEMFFLSTAEGPRFAALADEMMAKIKELGPNPVRRKSEARGETGESG